VEVDAAERVHRLHAHAVDLLEFSDLDRHAAAFARTALTCLNTDTAPTAAPSPARSRGRFRLAVNRLVPARVRRAGIRLVGDGLTRFGFAVMTLFGPIGRLIIRTTAGVRIIRRAVARLVGRFIRGRVTLRRDGFGLVLVADALLVRD